ncbi:two-component sensor histidine kinase [Pseudoalteromonas sp. A22]|uniref:sensor histidine kinase n=1 Tax=Pseudoalteromonas sp. A22 TaxID=327511 RepID=UPI001BA4BFE0|nr:histidine kinase [Pseudoalteromonas sp. A22]QUI61558.1 two-component sensor histidine kinase [Pseudoalteromonas sp. A22]
MSAFFRYPTAWLITTIFTWLAVAVPSLIYAQQKAQWLPWVQHIGVLILVLLCINESEKYYGYKVRYSMLFVLALLIQSINLTSPAAIHLIYNVKLVGILAFYVPLSFALGYILVTSCLYVASQYFFWGHGFEYLNAVLFACFQLFAYVVCKRMQKEQEAKEALQLAHSELSATQSLLSQSIAKQERLQLARELHDDVGHQITSLIVNLDVARRTAAEPLTELLDSCYLQAKDTLKCIRDLVSDKRSNEHIDLHDALLRLTESIPRLNIELDYEHHPLLEKLSYANCILKCCQEAITNTLKHAKADKMQVRVYCQQGLKVQISDNGITLNSIRFGNGLAGMQERIQELGGSLDVSTHQGVTLTIHFGTTNG